MGKKAAGKKAEEAGEAAEGAAEGAEAPAMPLEQAQELTQYDLTSKMTPFLDRHLIFPILNFLQGVGLYKNEDMWKAELQLLAETNMIDLAMDRYSTIGEPVPDSLNERREKVLKQLSDTRGLVFKMLEILEDEDKVKKIPGFKTLTDLCDEFMLEPDVIDGLVRYAKLQYDCGSYALSRELLKHCRTILQAMESLSPQHTTLHVSCNWGSLASALLNHNFDEATDLLFKLDEFLETTKAPKREVLVHRTWLLHWTLFAIFTADKVEPKLLDFFLNEKSLSIISLSCPHLFRYVGACLILQKRLKHLVKDTVWIIHHEAGSYSDPVTRFLLALYTEMDYDEAQHELQRCEMVCKGDYFLSQHWGEFQENARLHIFESYCRIHQCINIQMIASKLNMQAEEAELWIVKLIQNAKLDARIDSEKSRVVMTKAPPNVYQQVIEKTKNLAFRSTMLVSNLEKT